MAKAVQTTLSISFSLGAKANIGNYESADAHVSRSETWDVSELSDKEVNALFAERYEAIKTELDDVIQTEYKEMKE